MSGWNYRVMRRRFPTEDRYEIHEVYYDEAGEPSTWTVNAVSPCGETLEELRDAMVLFQRALEKPVLEWDEEKRKE